MTDETPTRRYVLAVTGGTIAAGLAGCLDGTTSPAGTTDDDTDTTTTADDDDGHGHDHEYDHELGHPEEHVDVSMETDDAEDTHHFVPHVVHLEEGGAVTWVIDSGGHDTVAYHPDNADLLPTASERRIPETAEPWESELLRTEGETFELTFEEAGIYDYACTIVEHGHGPERGQGPIGHHPTHEETGMVGRVIVGWPDLDPDAQPALRSPPEDMPHTARRELEGFNDRTRAALEDGDGH
ncbi:cupredoxin domain-containing protein [Natrialbaceae archaeon AArc-T1-2]|uniref:cupredoxin domain-containing protein n=1 Tax=Natrialbaceae archaeon AArc-T1-2 TaxID=3053904 RepID=UPI00255AB1AC|nr:plastocyanin/azurin family copper-binding protein [Natrialbaceae archaeon AArc-T1-2]WIV66755.1 plastocyanin/azurin family copper-binding protein [Natrialbaceae archaeon AArc-T1-2]